MLQQQSCRAHSFAIMRHFLKARHHNIARAGPVVATRPKLSRVDIHILLIACLMPELHVPPARARFEHGLLAHHNVIR